MTRLQLADAIEMYKRGIPPTEIAGRYGVSVPYIVKRARAAGAKPQSQKLANACQAAKRKRAYEKRRAEEMEMSALRRDAGLTNHVGKGRSQLIRKEEADRLMAEIPQDTRGNTGRLCGDPLPGRSALDRRAGAK